MTLQRKSRKCALYPTTHQGQVSPTGHQRIFYSRSHQGLLITANKFRCTKKSFVINHCSSGRVLWRQHFNASRDNALPHTTSGPKSPTGHQRIFCSSSHQGLLITANKFRCTNKSFVINHCSNGRVVLRRHFNASRDNALHHTTSGPFKGPGPCSIRAQGPDIAIGPQYPNWNWARFRAQGPDLCPVSISR